VEDNRFSASAFCHDPLHPITLLSEGFFLGLQMDYDLMQRRREIDRDLKTIRPRAA
jgi:hypothetical protein